MGIVFKNNAKTTLASSLSNSATSATVTDGSVFPSLSAGEFFLVTFDDGTNNEICKCTARSGNTLTIVRAQESTTARAFSSGDSAEGRVTAGVLEQIQENIASKSANQTVFNTTTSGGATTYNIGTNPGVEANAMVFLNGVLQHHDTLSFSGTNLTFDAAPANGLALEVIIDNLINLQSSNLTVDSFTAADVSGSPQTDFTLSDTPAAETNLIVFVDGVFQDQDAYTISSNTLTITTGVIAGRGVTVYVINPVNIGTPSDSTVTSAKLSGNITMPGTLTVGSNDVAFDSPTFVVDNANSRVGLGTASPSVPVDIVGDVKMSADLTVDTTTLVVDSSNNRVGIGTSSPDNELHVHGVGTLLSSDSYFVAQIQTDRNDDGSNDDGIFQFVNGSSKTVKGEIRFDESTNTFELGHGDNQNHLVIDSSGKVGIGTASPSTLLHLGGTAPGDSIIRQDSTSSGTNWEIGERSAGKWQIFEDDGDSIVATFMSTGRVGIGTESPASALHISGGDNTAAKLTITNTANSNTYSIHAQNNAQTLNFQEDGTTVMGLGTGGALQLGYNGASLQQANSDAFSIITPASGGGQGLAFKRLDSNNDQSLGHISWSNNTQDGLGRVRAKTIGAVNSLGILFETADAGTLAVRCGVRPEGQFVAGNTSLSMPNYPGTVTAHRTGDSSVTDANTWSFNATANGYDRDFGYKASGTGSYAYGVINTGETTWMSRLDFSGAIHLTNTTVQNISDRRLKKDIVDANSQWDDIKGLKFKNFKWKDETRGTDTYLGLIADEVEAVSPGLVGIDAVTAETMPEDGIDPEYKNVKYSIVWMKAVKALQEAQARIETLEAEVKILKEG